MSAADTHAAAAAIEAAAARLVDFLETGRAPAGLFTDDVFCDFTPPRWRLQAHGIDATLALRRAGHPAPGRVVRSRLDPTPGGFVLEFEERWHADGGDWSSREMLRADLRGDAICAMSVYCTGDWDAARRAEHAAAVALLRP